ncbi:conserved hypothetical protein [Talaromyces stipitatus ATCC 10500]|uniref:Uncharacterized protein n=1 Tax=Talaromyces stipitatus (strain ATCC 10500 / CBS 375.48 / QM 6759 / NRRL 1006) TaxID=441959 RepID=B8MKH5_TALSN|nr:uncharacterized protein TSTA_047760 [Talaromyces stipitatus ATCC 10500]EED15330.1 conserved hypothetical protein [Talaromyces stipitatus ATCC 10500]
MDNYNNFDGTFDFGSFINFPEDNTMESNNNADFRFPTLEGFSADPLSFSDVQLLPGWDLSQYDANANTFDSFGYSASSVSESPVTTNPDSFAPQAEDFRYLVDSRASADHSARSMKQKRRDAAIDLHLERFMASHSDSQLFPIGSEFSYSDTPSVTYSHESSRQSPVANTPASSTSSSDQSTVPQTGGRELVFDINLNTATNLPKKQKKRTKAQIEDYINARRNGACLKHKKQHKKCNCHEKQSAKSHVDAKARKQRATLSKIPVPAPGVKPTIVEAPALSWSSFMPSVYSHMDDQPFNEETDRDWALLADWERWDDLEHTSMVKMSQQQNSQTVSHGSLLPGRPRAPNTPGLSVSANLQPNVGYSAGGDGSFNHLLGLRNDTSDRHPLNAGQLVTTAGTLSVPLRRTERTSVWGQNISSVRSSVSISSQFVRQNGTVRLSTPIQQGLPTASVLVQLETSRRPGDTSGLMWNNSPLRPGVLVSSAITMLNAQQQPSAPAPRVLPAVPRAHTASQGLPMESSVSVASAAGWEQQTGPISTIPQRPPVASVQQVTQPRSAMDVLATVLAPSFQNTFSELQATNFVDAMFKDVSQAAFVVVQQYYSIFAAVLSSACWMSGLCVVALQGIGQLAMLFRSSFYHLAGEDFRYHKSLTTTCAAELSTSLSFGHPLVLNV